MKRMVAMVLAVLVALAGAGMAEAWGGEGTTSAGSDRFAAPGAGAPIDQVSDYALLRAAELTLADGYEWFRVTDRYVAQSGYDSGPRVSVGAGGGSGGYSSGVGVGVGTSFNLGGGPALTQTIEILMGRGQKPPSATGQVYDAADVQATIRSRI